MGLFDNFPYTNFHELNLDWILKVLKDIETTIDQFVSLNIIKYADPIQWDITRQYPKNTIVVDPISGTAYISVDNVPQGVPLSNTDYWSVVFDLGRFITLASQNFANSYEAVLTTTATMPTAQGHWVVWNSILYEALNDIHVGDAYVIATDDDPNSGNIKKTTVETFTDRIIAQIRQEILDRQDADTALGGRIDQEILDRQAADTALGGRIDQEILDRQAADTALGGRIDGVINSLDGEVLNRIAGDTAIENMIGALSDLHTTDKRSIVKAINSLIDGLPDVGYVTPQDFGAVGDGVTDDTVALQSAFDSGSPVKFISNYAVSSVEYTGSSNFVDFNGHWLIGIGKNSDYVLVIYEAMYNVFNDIRIKIASGSHIYYYGCIRIHSSASRQSQYNVFNGMDLRECWHGIVWGAKLGETSISNAQSETFINNFRDRSVAVPFLGNQDNGYITFVGGVFDINQYEQWDDTRFSFDNNVCVLNRVGKVNFIGCEFAATVNVEHKGFDGSDIYAYESILEICGTQAWIRGNFSLINWYNGYIGQATKTPFVVENGTVGTVVIENGEFHHGGIVAGDQFLYGYDAPQTDVIINNVAFRDTHLASGLFGNLNVKCNNFRLPVDNITINTHDITGMSCIDNNSTDVNACGSVTDCSISYDNVLGRRGVAIQFSSTQWGSFYTDYIPVFGGMLYQYNAKAISTGDVLILLEFYDDNKSPISSTHVQTSTTTALNRSSLRYTPSGTKYMRLRITNGTNTNSPYCKTADVCFSTARR